TSSPLTSALGSRRQGTRCGRVGHRLTSRATRSSPEEQRRHPARRSGRALVITLRRLRAWAGHYSEVFDLEDLTELAIRAGVGGMGAGPMESNVGMARTVRLGLCGIVHLRKIAARPARQATWMHSSTAGSPSPFPRADISVTIQ